MNYQLLINWRDQEIKKLKISKEFIDYSQTIDYIQENLEDCDPSKKRKVLIVFDDVTTHIETNKMLSPVVTKLFLRGKKL